jgi:hypothetical protein
VINAQALKRIANKFKPELLAVLSLSDLLGEREREQQEKDPEREKVVKLSFTCEDQYLIVSTTRRLVLIEMKIHSLSLASSHDRLSLYESLRTRSTSVGSVSEIPISSTKYTGKHSSSAIIGFQSFVQIDRAMPGLLGLFDFHIRECVVEDEREKEEGGGAAAGGEKVGSKSTSTAPRVERKIVQWRIIENEDALSDKASKVIKKKCTVSRLEWSEEMFQALLDKLKPCYPSLLPLGVSVNITESSGEMSPMVDLDVTTV